MSADCARMKFCLITHMLVSISVVSSEVRPAGVETLSQNKEARVSFSFLRGKLRKCYAKFCNLET
jgi:hypothetical protein